MPSLNRNLRLTEFFTAIKIRLGLPSWGLPRVSEAPTSSLVMVSRVEGRDWLLPLTGVKDRRFSLEGDEEKAGGRSREVSAIPFLLLIWVGVEGASSSWEPRGWRCRGRWRRSRGAE